MKNLLIAAMLLITTSATSQKQCKGILGIPFGATLPQIESSIKERYPEATVYRRTDDGLVYRDIPFGGRKTTGVIFKISNTGQWHTAKVLIHPSTEIGVFQLYDDVVSDLTGVYGKAQRAIEDYKYPYDSDDKGKLTPLKGGYVTINTIWTFDEQGNLNTSSEDYAISCTIEPQAYVLIEYQSTSLVRQEINKQNEQNAKDY